MTLPSDALRRRSSGRFAPIRTSQLGAAWYSSLNFAINLVGCFLQRMISARLLSPKKPLLLGRCGEERRLHKVDQLTATNAVRTLLRVKNGHLFATWALTGFMEDESRCHNSKSPHWHTRIQTFLRKLSPLSATVKPSEENRNKSRRPAMRVEPKTDTFEKGDKMKNFYRHAFLMLKEEELPPSLIN